MVECTGFENRQGCKLLGSSNLPLSAHPCFIKSTGSIRILPRMTNGEHLINIGNAGLALTMGSTQHYIEHLLVTLLDIEEVLDRGSALTFDSPEFLPQIESQLEAVRQRIRDMISGLGIDKATHIIQQGGGTLKSQFVIR